MCGRPWPVGRQGGCLARSEAAPRPFIIMMLVSWPVFEGRTHMMLAPASKRGLAGIRLLGIKPDVPLRHGEAALPEARWAKGSLSNSRHGLSASLPALPRERS